MKMSSLVILITPALVLVGTSIGVLTAAGKAGIANPGIHGFSEILYAFSSASNNNGSAFAGSPRTRRSTTPRSASACCSAVLARGAGARDRGLARPEEDRADGPGTLPTHTPLFVALLVGVVILVGR